MSQEHPKHACLASMRGVTLIELLVVVLLLLFISWFVWTAMTHNRPHAVSSEQIAGSQLRILATATKIYHDDFGELPDAADFVNIMIENEYFEPDYLVDPWGSKIRIEVLPGHVTFRSDGPNSGLMTDDLEEHFVAP